MATTYTPDPFHQALMTRLSTISDWSKSSLSNTQASLQAYRAAHPPQQVQAPASSSYGKSSSSGGGGIGYTPPAQGGGNTFENFMRAISQRESGGNYGAVNRDSGALGKYQIMPGNIPSWSRQALGHSISTSQFLRSPSLQEQVAQYMLRRYYNQYGPGGAAVAWYAGPGRVAGWARNTNSGFYNRPQGAYSSINAYARGILRAMGIL